MAVILSKAQQQRSLGIQPGSQWDGKNIPKDDKNGEGKQTSKEPSVLGKCWWNQEDIPSLQSTTIPYLAIPHEAHFMEYQRAQQP